MCVLCLPPHSQCVSTLICQLIESSPTDLPPHTLPPPAGGDVSVLFSAELLHIVPKQCFLVSQEAVMYLSTFLRIYFFSRGFRGGDKPTANQLWPMAAIEMDERNETDAWEMFASTSADDDAQLYSLFHLIV